MAVKRVLTGSLQSNGASPRLASIVAKGVEDLIVMRGWPVGELLGSEQSLIEHYGVSRSVLREAVRLLEHKQVATMRRGPGGGLIVCAPDATAIATTVANFFDFSAVGGEDLHQARRSLEVLALRLAVERMSESGLRELRLSVATGRQDQSAVPENLHAPENMHMALARLTRNSALSIFIQALSQAARAVELEWKLGDGGASAHSRIVTALVAGELGLAERHLIEHLKHTARRATEANPSRAAAITSNKLGERIARRIAADLHGSGHPVGSVIGSEATFLERYEVSRSVFRETVRILEYYDIVHMRRGPGGGVVIGARDPSSVVDAVTTYLDFMRIDPRHLREARRAVELSALNLAIERLDADGCERLRAELEAEAAHEMGSVYKKAPDLHVLIGELSGNVALHFFTLVLTRLQTSRIEAVQRTPSESAAIGHRIARAHDGVVEAMIAGDVGLARHRLERHLAAMTEFVAEKRVTAAPIGL